ncbi:MAG: hypothetical protein IID40_11460, partial [Planctomycetes bacterium]|nr:hypothetical protein [Planctomycetota bacterium]
MHGTMAGWGRFLVLDADHAGTSADDDTPAHPLGLLARVSRTAKENLTAGARVEYLLPDQAFVAVRTLNDLLAGAVPAQGSGTPQDSLYLPRTPSVRTRIFFRRERDEGGNISRNAILVFWT